MTFSVRLNSLLPKHIKHLIVGLLVVSYLQNAVLDFILLGDSGSWLNNIDQEFT